MEQKIKKLIENSPIFRLALVWKRFTTGFRYFKQPLWQLLTWLINSNETTNFTYALAPNNKKYLASLIAHVTGETYSKIMGYMDELDNDHELKSHIRSATSRSNDFIYADANPLYGRRLGWYAVVRAIKPKIIVETGVDKGLGSCILTSALMKNYNENSHGFYYGIDINPSAGYLLSGQYATCGRILFGDSATSLKNLDVEIDLFINDSDHSSDYERREYEIISKKLSHHAIVLGDNSHCTDELFRFSQCNNRLFLFFREVPLNHWYPGGGIGISFIPFKRRPACENF